MKHEIAMRWASALESGKYTQGFHSLKKLQDINGQMVETFCVWGVLCDLYIQETGAAFWSPFKVFVDRGHFNEDGLALVMRDGVTETPSNDAELREIAFVHPRTGDIVWPLNSDKWSLDTILPSVSIWSGACDERVVEDISPDSKYANLMFANDKHVPFSVLAPMIRKNWARL